MLAHPGRPTARAVGVSLCPLVPWAIVRLCWVLSGSERGAGGLSRERSQVGDGHVHDDGIALIREVLTISCRTLTVGSPHSQG